jgi:YEATS domain-containing protein 1/3
LFGTPIKTTKVSPDPKKPSPSPKVSPLPKSGKPPDKPSSDKQVSGSKPVKHSVQKDSREGVGSSSKEEKRDRNKDRDKSREKTKHPATPPKQPPTPPKCLSASKPTKDEPKKVQIEETKGKCDAKSLGDSSKSEKKKKDKKSKDEKPKKERHKDYENKSCEKVDKNEKLTKESKDKEKETARKPEKDSNKESEKPKEREKFSSDGDKERTRHKHKKKERSKRDESGKERDREREKGIKKSSSDNKKTSETKDRDRNGITPDANKKHSRSRSRSPQHTISSPTKPSPSPEKLVHPPAAKDKPAKRPLTKLFDELKDHESSDSNLSPDEDSIDLPAPQLTKPSTAVDVSGKLETVVKPDVTSKNLVNTGSNSQSNSRPEATKSKPESANQERNSLTKVSNSKQKDKSASKKIKEKKDPSGSGGKDEGGRRSDKDTGKKRKHRNSGKEKEEEASGGGREDGVTAPKLSKLDTELSRTDDPVGWISSEVPMQAEVSTTTASADDVHTVEMFAAPIVAPAHATATPMQFSPEYVLQLKDLQRKIMTLEDNAELQRVVQVIAETGQYEITKKTFDFDLCALDRSTVKRLQDFFTTS